MKTAVKAPAKKYTLTDSDKQLITAAYHLNSVGWLNSDPYAKHFYNVCDKMVAANMYNDDEEYAFFESPESIAAAAFTEKLEKSNLPQLGTAVLKDTPDARRLCKYVAAFEKAPLTKKQIDIIEAVVHNVHDLKTEKLGRFEKTLKHDRLLLPLLKTKLYTSFGGFLNTSAGNTAKLLWQVEMAREVAITTHIKKRNEFTKAVSRTKSR